MREEQTGATREENIIRAEMQNLFRAIGKLKLRHAIYMATETRRNDGDDGDEEDKQEDIRERRRKI